MAERPGTSPDQQRALMLLKAGAIGGHLGGVAASVACLVLRGVASGASSAVAAAITLAFYIVGQAVQVRVADAPPQKVLTAALVSYGARVGLLAGLLAFSLGSPERFPALDAPGVVAGTLAVVVTWLAAEIVAFSRMRFPVFDTAHSKGGTRSAT